MTITRRRARVRASTPTRSEPGLPTEVTGITGVRVDHIDVDVAGTDIPTAARPRVR